MGVHPSDKDDGKRRPLACLLRACEGCSGLPVKEVLQIWDFIGVRDRYVDEQHLSYAWDS